MVSGIIGLGLGAAGNAHAAEPRSQADFCILPFTLCSAISRRRVSLRSGGNASGLLRAAAAWVDVLCSASPCLQIAVEWLHPSSLVLRLRP